MNYFKKKLEEKREYIHKKPEDKSYLLKKSKMQRMKHPPKNAKLGMF